MATDERIFSKFGWQKGDIVIRDSEGRKIDQDELESEADKLIAEDEPEARP